MRPDHPTHLLRFTGTCDEAEFKRRCAAQDFWYHSYYFDNGYSQPGDYDIGRDIASYGFPDDMSGMRVLDVGTGSGWFATYFEQRGAEVTTVDARGYCDFDMWGRHHYPDIATEKPAPDRVLPDGQAIYYSRVSSGFWIMKDILGLKASYRNARVYELSPELFGGRTFDLVFMGALLMHVRDPIGALMAARSVCSHRLITNSLKPDGDSKDAVPYMEFLNNSDAKINWWRPNRACLRGMVEAAGFKTVAIDGTVDITTDKIFVDKTGRYSGVTQTLYLVDATV